MRYTVSSLDGMVKRFNLTVKDRLAIYLSENERTGRNGCSIGDDGLQI